MNFQRGSNYFHFFLVLNHMLRVYKFAYAFSFKITMVKTELDVGNKMTENLLDQHLTKYSKKVFWGMIKKITRVFELSMYTCFVNYTRQNLLFFRHTFICRIEVAMHTHAANS